jgi:hypothetical protein
MTRDLYLCLLGHTMYALCTRYEHCVNTVWTHDVHAVNEGGAHSCLQRAQCYLFGLGYTTHTLCTRYEHCMNTQVEHILASTGVSGTSVVWDLRQKRPVISFTDSATRCVCVCVCLRVFSVASLV